MRKVLMLAALVGFVAPTFAQEVTPCSELFISEYVEGSRNNKALEIYNPTNQTIDLSQYRLTRWQNGSATWDKQYSDTLSGNIEPYSAIVVCIDRRDTTQLGRDTPVVEELRMKADLFLSGDYNTSYAMSFNGDDALSLDKYNEQFSTWTLVDIFGKIGERPPFGGWSDSFPYNNGLGVWYSANHTLIRKPHVLTGCDTVAPVKRGLTTLVPQAWNPVYFDPSEEWELYPRDYFDSLGMHSNPCQALKTDDVLVLNNLSLFPNPSKNIITLNSTERITYYTIFDLNGKLVMKGEGNSGFELKIDIASLNAGLYQVMVISEQGNSFNNRFEKI